MTRIPKPLGNHVVVEPVVTPDKSAGGIYVPEQWKQPGGEAKVIAVGPGRLDYAGRLIAPDVKPGDKIIYSWVDGREINIDGRALRLLDADHILGVLP